MLIGQVWLNANPELRTHLRKTSEARAAAFYAAWRRVSAPLRGLAEFLRRVHRERQTYDALSRLGDRALSDIGLSRSEVRSVSQAIAAEPLEAGMTIADLRRARSGVFTGNEAPVAPMHRTVEQRSRGVAQPPAAPVQQDRVQQDRVQQDRAAA